jgi:predicted ribosome quality control (RQC) complex YloA/Tae2 family protein
MNNIKLIYLPNIPEEIKYYIGKNALNNEEIIDLANPNDIWIHAKNVSSCHVIACIPENLDLSKKQKKTIIKKGFELCKQNTLKLRNEKNVNFINTQVKNIIKTEVTGQVIIVPNI